MAHRLHKIAEMILTRLPSKSEVEFFLELLYDEEHNMSEYDANWMHPDLRLTHKELIERQRNLLGSILDFGLYFCEECEDDSPVPERIDRSKSIPIPVQRIPPIPQVTASKK